MRRPPGPHEVSRSVFVRAGGGFGRGSPWEECMNGRSQDFKSRLGAGRESRLEGQAGSYLSFFSPSLQLDETLAERLWGLTEMFPDGLRSAAGATFDVSLSVAQKMYR